MERAMVSSALAVMMVTRDGEMDQRRLGKDNV